MCESEEGRARSLALNFSPLAARLAYYEQLRQTAWKWHSTETSVRFSLDSRQIFEAEEVK